MNETLWLIDIYDLDFIDPTLKEVLKSREEITGPGVITSLYRIDDPGVHGTLPLRGIDERCHLKSVGEAIAGYINARWIYDPTRPKKKVCICHNTGAGLHIHYQVHANTTRRKEGRDRL